MHSLGIELIAALIEPVLSHRGVLTASLLLTFVYDPVPPVWVVRTC